MGEPKQFYNHTRKQRNKHVNTCESSGDLDAKRAAQKRENIVSGISDNLANNFKPF